MFVPMEIKQRRLSVCSGCKYRRKKFKLFFITWFKADQCKVCKCSIDLKTSLSLSKCPKNKWR